MFDDGSGGSASGAEPSLRLVASLLATSPVGLDDFDIIDQIADYERCISWLRAKQSRAVEEATRRRAVIPGETAGGTLKDRGGPAGASEYLVAEISAALCISAITATRRIESAAALVRRLPVTLAALEEGRIDFPRALAVVEQTYVLDDCAAAKVEQAVVPRSTGRPMPTLRRRLRREVLRADRKAAARRAEEERAHRKVVFRPVQDGMAELLAILPAEVARAIYATLTRVARGECGDERTMDARRADVLGALVLGDRALFDPGAGVDEDVAGGPADATDPDSASPAGSRDASPEDGSSAGTPGRGHESDEPMGHAGETGAPMDSARAGAQADGAGAQADGDAGGSESNSATSAGTTPAGAGTGRMRTGPGRPRWPAPTTIVQVTVGAGTLLGLDDEPGELAGYGPIPAPTGPPTCRRRHLATDPDRRQRPRHGNRSGPLPAGRHPGRLCQDSGSSLPVPDVQRPGRRLRPRSPGPLPQRQDRAGKSRAAVSLPSSVENAYHVAGREITRQHRPVDQPRGTLLHRSLIRSEAASLHRSRRATRPSDAASTPIFPKQRLPVR